MTPYEKFLIMVGISSEALGDDFCESKKTVHCQFVLITMLISAMLAGLEVNILKQKLEA